MKLSLAITSLAAWAVFPTDAKGLVGTAREQERKLNGYSEGTKDSPTPKVSMSLDVNPFTLDYTMDIQLSSDSDFASPTSLAG